MSAHNPTDCAGTCHGWSVYYCAGCGPVQACGGHDCPRCKGDPGPIRGSTYEGDRMVGPAGEGGRLVRWIGWVKGQLLCVVAIDGAGEQTVLFGQWVAADAGLRRGVPS